MLIFSTKKIPTYWGSKNPKNVLTKYMNGPLGVARERSNWLAKIFLYWVNPLILKGRRDQIKSTDDVFDVPPKLRLLEAIGLKLNLVKFGNIQKQIVLSFK